MINYIEKFPYPSICIPEKLKKLLTPTSSENPVERIEITAHFQADPDDSNREYYHMIMASVPEEDAMKIKLLNESTDGVVSFSEPLCDNKGDIADWLPSISGYDYLVASWGNGSFYSYSLAEKVWMALGLSGRTIGNTDQKIIYDDLSLPIIAVAEGEVTNEHYWHQNRNVLWTMRNDYLRYYLWMRGQVGVRIFFYEKLIEDTAETRAFMQGKEHHREILDGGWCDLDVREHNGKLLMQVWATVVAVSAEKCEKEDVFALVWPGEIKPITKERAKNPRESDIVYLKDTFYMKHYPP